MALLFYFSKINLSSLNDYNKAKEKKKKNNQQSNYSYPIKYNLLIKTPNLIFFIIIILINNK
jgi:hypothetical protein